MEETTSTDVATETVATEGLETSPAAESETGENALLDIFDHITGGESEESDKPGDEANTDDVEPAAIVDLESVFTEPNTDANRIEQIRAHLKDSPEVLSLLEAETQQLTSEREGFQKLHEQATALKEPFGVQSLTELTAPIQYGIDEATRWNNLKSEVAKALPNLGEDATEAQIASAAKAMPSLQSIVVDLCEMTGLDSDQIADLIEGTRIEARQKPIQELTDEMALRHLGLKPDRYAAILGLEAKETYLGANSEKWGKVSKAVGFTVDPVKMFEASRQYKDANVEGLLALTYPTEFATYKAGLSQKSTAKAEKVKDAPLLTKEKSPGKPGPITTSAGLLSFLNGS